MEKLVSDCGSLVKIAFLCLVCVERGAAKYDLKPLHREHSELSHMVSYRSSEIS